MRVLVLLGGQRSSSNDPVLGPVIRLKEDGEYPRFTVVFAQGAVEDPTEGAQEAFMDMVREVASRESILEAGWSLNDVIAATCALASDLDYAS